MRILCLCWNLSPPTADGDAGATVRALELLARMHDVWLVARGAPTEVGGVLESLASYCHRVTLVPLEAPGPHGRAALGARRASERALRLAALEILAIGHIDTIQIDHPALLRCLPPGSRRPLVLDARACSSASMAASRSPWWVRWVIAPSARTSIAEVARRSSVTLAASVAQRVALEEAIGAPWPIHVVPPALDLAHYDSIWRNRHPEGQRLVLAPILDAVAMESACWFLRVVFPRVMAEQPEVCCDVPVRAASRELRALAAGLPGVRLCDSFGDEDWRAAGALIVPAPGPSGADFAVLSALAMGVPVLAAPVACANLGLVSGEHLLNATSADEMTAECLRLLRDRKLAFRLILGGRRLVLERYASAATLAGLAAAYDHAERRTRACAYCL